MQNFTLHTHNGEQHFDGRAPAETMIAAAAAKGFTAIGVTNHLIVHPNIKQNLEKEPMFFNNFADMEKTCRRHIEILQNLKGKYNIDIKIGFETDFFTHKEWRNGFEKMLPRLEVDYLIGASHFLKNEDESFLCNIYYLKDLNPRPDDAALRRLVHNHYRNIEAAIRSGYFRFIAHLDYCAIFDLGEEEEFNEDKYRLIAALKETKTAFEINTSGYDRINRPHPAPWIIKELAHSGVKTVLSDDSHHPDHLGRHFAKAETLLEELGWNPADRLQLADL